MQRRNKIKLIIGCRLATAKRYEKNRDFRTLYEERIKILNWNSNDIEKLICAVNHENKSRCSVKDACNNILDVARGNPLICKIYLSIIDTNVELGAVNNHYYLYKRFFTSVIKYEISKVKDFDDCEKILKSIFLKMGRLAFMAYKNRFFTGCFSYDCKDEFENDFGKRILTFWYNLDTKEFYHKSYEEFLVSYYYVNVLLNKEKCIQETVQVLSCMYVNAYSDFITQGINFEIQKDLEKENIARYLIYIYYFSLYKNDIRKRYYEKFYNGFFEVKQLERDNQLVINSLSNREVLYLKYEITFRIGRLNISHPKEFLQFIYKNDTLQSYPKDYKYSKFMEVILKRQCAISDSFLGESIIELDYVSKMLDYKDQYIKEYDLVNRTHTLIYYGDVEDTNILEYIDNGQSDWKNARDKRLNRLQKPPISYTMADRIKCFRLFDLGTIYSFLASRAKSKLSEHEINIVKETVVHNIDNISKYREDLMEEIKNKIIEKNKINKEASSI